MIEAWIKEIKKNCNPDVLGMILVHNGIVRATAKDGKPVKAMKLSYDKDMLQDVMEKYKAEAGIAEIKVWINQGELQIGDDIMNVCVAGRFRTDILPVFQELLTIIKNEIVREEEVEVGKAGLTSSLWPASERRYL
jgi:molybdopterin synthase catalytic subunit